MVGRDTGPIELKSCMKLADIPISNIIYLLTFRFFTNPRWQSSVWCDIKNSQDLYIQGFP